MVKGNQTLRLAAALSCLAIVPLGASAQSRMSVAEATQLFAAAGFRIVNHQAINRCGRASKPRVSFVDISGDRRPEALFIDADAACYAPSGRYYAVLTKEGTTWRAVISGTGTIKALSTETAGWLDMHTTEPNCDRNHRYNGRSYAAVTDCSGHTIAGVPPPAQQAQAQPAPPQTPQSAPSTAPSPAAGAKLPPADEAAAFKAAGFAKRGGMWRSGCDDPGTASYQPGRIESVADLNGDGLPDAVISEGGTYCYGNTGQAYWLVSRLANGSWKLMANGTGIPEFLKTKGAGGWPDVSVGGPGFCFPVERWNGREYKLQRWEYEGKACTPQR
jgi:hypothetical protein